MDPWNMNDYLLATRALNVRELKIICLEHFKKAHFPIHFVNVTRFHESDAICDPIIKVLNSGAPRFQQRQNFNFSHHTIEI